jgi:hypothetical protein
MSTIIYLFEFQLPMCSLYPEFLERNCGTIPVAEIISGKIEIFSKLQRFLIVSLATKVVPSRDVGVRSPVRSGQVGVQNNVTRY